MIHNSALQHTCTHAVVVVVVVVVGRGGGGGGGVVVVFVVVCVVDLCLMVITFQFPFSSLKML